MRTPITCLLVAYAASFVNAFLDWRKGRSTYGGGLARDPPFTHPAEAPELEEEDGYAPRHAPQRISTLPPEGPDDVGSPFGDENKRRPAQPRQSMDAYGAFNDPPPTGYGAPPFQSPVSPTGGVSRTMQFADPYAAVQNRLSQGVFPQYDYAGGHR